VKRRTLTRYLISEILPPFFFGLLAFTFILLITRILRLVELAVTRGVSLIQIGKLLALILPTFLELTVPMAFLLAILLGLGRLSSDHEIVALKASGISPTQILWPIAVTALFTALITLLLTLVARPAANLALKQELYNIAKTRISAALKEKVFNDAFPNILVYFEEIVPPGNTAQGVLIVDKRDRARDDIILGKVALITTNEETRTLGLKLFDGSIYEKERNRPGFSQTLFDIYDFKLDLDEFVAPVTRKQAGPKEMSFESLITSITQKQAEGATALPERIELHQRFSFAFTPMIFCLLGVSLVLLPGTSRANRSWGMALCLFWLFAYYSLLSFGKALGEKGMLPPGVAMWFPNIVLAIIGLLLYRKALYESPLRVQQHVENAFSWCAQQFPRLREKG